MPAYKYNFAGCIIELISDEPIEKERNYSIFQCASGDADYSIKIIKTDILPEKKGDAVFVSERRSVYRADRELRFTAYFNTAENAYTDYACKVNETELYIKSNEKLRELTVFDALNLPSMLLAKSTGILHCSFVDAFGEAILFAGEKQVGKSTQARLWAENAGCETLNGDRAALNVTNGVLFAHGIPFNGTSRICVNKSLPLKAIILPSIGTENILKKLSAKEAFMMLFGKFHYDIWDESAFDTLTELIGNIAEAVPVYTFSCLKDPSAVKTVACELGISY